MASEFMVITWSLSRRARWWNHRARAWWVRIQADQCSMWPGGQSRVAAAARRRISGMVSGISQVPGDRVAEADLGLVQAEAAHGELHHSLGVLTRTN